MRIAKLELLAFGPFRGVVLDFAKPGVHVVLGRNEAGKSTTLRAITGLLYGIDPKTPDAHVHKFADLRIGGVLENAAGEWVRVVRRKGNTNTLLDTAEQPLDDGVIRRLLGGVTRETFQHAFGLNHEMLRAGAEALLEGRGNLGESLFDASVGGGGDVKRVLDELSSQADRIYKPRASTLPLNDALKAFAEAQKLVRERQSLPDAYLSQVKGLEDATKERDERANARVELEAKKARLERVKRVVPLERRRERTRERLCELGALAGQWDRAMAFKDRFVVYERSIDQLRTCLADAERLGYRVVEAARRAGIAPGADTEAFRLDARKEASVRRLLEERTKCASDVDAMRKNLARAERERTRAAEEARETTAEPPPRLVIDALAGAVDRARALGDIDARVATERARADRKRRDLEARAAALGLFEGALDALVTLRLPPVASVERLEARAAEVNRVNARLRERAADLTKEAASIEKQRAAHSGDFAPPDAAALATARDARDETWRRLRDTEGADARRTLEVDLERLLRHADAVADRMIREADRVTTLARLRSEADAVAKQLASVTEETAAAEKDRAALDAELASLFAGAGMRPLGFAEMRHWLEAHAQIVDAERALAVTLEDISDEETRATRARSDLARALVATGDVELEGERLVDLVARGARRLAGIEAGARATEEALKLTAKTKREIAELEAVLQSDDRALAEVTAKLESLLAPIGVPADASAEEVNRALEALRDFFDATAARSETEARARSLDADVRGFEADLARVLAELAPDLVGEPRETARALFARAEQAREATHELAAVTSQIEGEGEIAITDAERLLVSNPDAAERAEDELATELDDLAGEVQRLDRSIGSLANGLEQIRVESHAAEAAAAAQTELARVREHAERWCRVKLAQAILAREIERYRQENQGPLLASSSAFFARLTLGAYAGIKAGFDAHDRPCLRCVRGETEVDVVGLSDGTRDQLYLSLRLASLLRRAEVAESMPLVLDDVLIQLDDQRASAALSVLAEVSERMQVLFFTHHARLVELARAAIPSGRLVVHELASHAAPREALSAP